MARTQTIEAIILSGRDFGEADKLLTVFSRQLGKITLLAKGVRRIKSRKGGNVDVLNNARLSIVQGKSLPIVTEAETISSHGAIKENLSAAIYAYYVVELINTLTVEEQEHHEVYLLLRDSLAALEKSPRRIIIHAFEIKLLGLLGFWDSRLLGKNDEKLLELTRKIEVQSLKELVTNKFDSGDVISLGQLTRKQLEYVAEHEFNSPKILAQLRQSLQQA